jgi:uncharacterized membrane protein
MKILAILIAGLSGAMFALTWNTPAAVAWAIAFCGWVPHCFSSEESINGNS